MNDFISNAVSSEWRARIEREQASFVRWVRARARGAARDETPPNVALDQPDHELLVQLPVHVFTRYLFECYVQASKDARAAASAVNTARRLAGGSSLLDDFSHARFLNGVRKIQPTGVRALGRTPYAPWQLVEWLPTDDSFVSLRLRVLVLLRIVTLMRAAEPSTISVSSVREITDPLGRRVVVFLFRSKNTTAFHIASDSNYVEYLSRPAHWRASWPPFTVFCPATQLLKLKNAVLRRARLANVAVDGARPLSLFTTLSANRSLARSTLSSLVTTFIRSVPSIDDGWSAHSIRAAAQQMLDLLGVPATAINTRAGWVTAGDSATRVSFYTRFRLVRFNFADLLLFPGTIPM